MDILSLERIWNHTPIVESDNLSRYCPIDDITFMGMESDFINESSKFHLHVFYRMDSENQGYIDMYIWDWMLYPDTYRRIIIQNGFVLAEEDESLFIEYTRKLESEGMFDREEFDHIKNHFSYVEDIRFSRRYYPSVALQAFYFSGHKGVREILCKAGLDFISYHLEQIPGINLIGSTPASIVGYGVTNKFLRIVNTPEMVKCLFSEEQLQRNLTVYKAYSGYVEKDLPNFFQCCYFRSLYEEGQFGGTGFNRTLYRRLGEVQDWGEFYLYERYMELKKNMPFKGKIPLIEDIYDEVSSLEMTNRYLIEGQELDTKIQQRLEDKCYQYESEQYILRMPRNLLEICKEAKEQGNCLLSSGYVEKHANGETTIIFIRNKDKPEHAFVTAEICNGKLKQVYGCGNCLPERAVYEFIEGYCRKHWIKYDPEELIWDSIEELDESEFETELEEYLEAYRKKQYVMPIEFEEKCAPCIQLTFMDVFPDIFKNEQ